MEKTDSGTSVGVDDPYRFVERCGHLTDAGKCRFAVEHGDPSHEIVVSLCRWCHASTHDSWTTYSPAIPTSHTLAKKVCLRI